MSESCLVLIGDRIHFYRSDADVLHRPRVECVPLAMLPIVLKTGLVAVNRGRRPQKLLRKLAIDRDQAFAPSA